MRPRSPQGGATEGQGLEGFGERRSSRWQSAARWRFTSHGSATNRALASSRSRRSDQPCSTGNPERWPPLSPTPTGPPKAEQVLHQLEALHAGRPHAITTRLSRA